MLLHYTKCREMEIYCNLYNFYKLQIAEITMYIPTLNANFLNNYKIILFFHINIKYQIMLLYMTYIFIILIYI